MNLIASGSNEDLLKKGNEHLYIMFLHFSKEESKLKSVKLISLDGLEFEVDYDCACQSGTIKELLESSESILLSCFKILSFSF